MLVESNETFRQIFQSSVEAIIICDKTNRILLANPVSERMCAYEADGLLGLCIEDLLPKNLRKRHMVYRKEFNAQPEPRPMGIVRDPVAR